MHVAGNRSTCSHLHHGIVYNITLIMLGAFLERCSEIESKLAESGKRFQEKATSSFITPLKAFLEIDIKNVLVRRFGDNGLESKFTCT